jgi:predicted nucleic acid-binding protein
MREAMAKGWSLKPPDAIHLATALQHSADRFHTYDDRLSKHADISGLIIAEPHAVQPQLPEA